MWKNLISKSSPVYVKSKQVCQRLFGQGSGNKVSEELPESLQKTNYFKLSQDIPNPVHQLVKPGTEKIVGSWLLVGAGTVFCVILLGGQSRLSTSEKTLNPKWRPKSKLIPLTDAEWNEEFQHYKTCPEWQNKKLSVDQFKYLVYLDLLHRLSGLAAAGVMAAPLAFFMFKGWIKLALLKRLAGIFGLGAFVGLNGLAMREFYNQEGKERALVYSKYVHTNSTFLIYSSLLWNCLTLIRRPQEQMLNPQLYKNMKKFRLYGLGLIGMLAMNAMTGASSTGTNAGRAWGGNIVPDFKQMFTKTPFLSNFFENPETVLTDHRLLAYLTFLYSGFVTYQAFALEMAFWTRYASVGLFGLVGLQIVNGMMGLENKMPWGFSSFHQLNALWMMTAGIIVAHTVRSPSVAFAAYLSRFI